MCWNDYLSVGETIKRSVFTEIKSVPTRRQNHLESIHNQWAILFKNFSSVWKAFKSL